MLVVPSRRTELIEIKLARLPGLNDALRRRRWEFLSTTRLWSLADNNRAVLGDFVASLGLCPPAERDREQLALF